MDGDDDYDFVGNVVYGELSSADIEELAKTHSDIVFTLETGEFARVHLKAFPGTSKSVSAATTPAIPDWLPSTDTRVDASHDELRLEALLSHEDADAVIGDLAELAERDAATMPQEEAAKRRKARAREVRASLPKSAWSRLLRGFLYSMEMQFYWYGAVVLCLIYAFVHVIQP